MCSFLLSERLKLFTRLYSSRSDLECSFLFTQDRVPAFSPEKAKAFVQSELGCPIEVLFKEFEDRPIAAASLGQVFVIF